MKKFNQVITVSVAVDSIAEQLLSNMNAEFKHSEIVVESIIGTLLSEGKLSYLYNSLNGYSAEINFRVGDEIVHREGYKVWAYWEEGGSRSQRTLEKEVTIVDINLFADKKLKISYELPNSEGKSIKHTEWVSHLDWDIIGPRLLEEQFIAQS